MLHDIVPKGIPREPRCIHWTKMQNLCSAWTFHLVDGILHIETSLFMACQKEATIMLLDIVSHSSCTEDVSTAIWWAIQMFSPSGIWIICSKQPLHNKPTMIMQALWSASWSRMSHVYQLISEETVVLVLSSVQFVSADRHHMIWLAFRRQNDRIGDSSAP